VAHESNICCVGIGTIGPLGSQERDQCKTWKPKDKKAKLVHDKLYPGIDEPWSIKK